jgi:putative transcriptional regulator
VTKLISNVRNIRTEKDIPAQAVIDTLGITHGTYYKKELGQLRFSLTEAKKISELFEMSVEDIFFADEVSKMEQE